MTITIYHNTACGTSRNTLQLIRDAGFEPVIIDYVRQPPGREELAGLITRAGISVRAAMRDKGALYEELGLANAALSDAALLDAMETHPILINRPIVVSELGVRLCRPAEKVLEILPQK